MFAALAATLTVVPSTATTSSPPTCDHASRPGDNAGHNRRNTDSSGFSPSRARALASAVAAGTRHPTPASAASRPAVVPHLEYRFATGDRVDVMFENHLPDRTVVEVEVEGEQQICVGIHQAIKYRSLAAADAGYPLLTSRVRSLVVAYNTD